MLACKTNLNTKKQLLQVSVRSSAMLHCLILLRKLCSSSKDLTFASSFDHNFCPKYLMLCFPYEIDSVESWYFEVSIP